MNPKETSKEVIQKLEGIIQESDTFLDYHPSFYIGGSEIDIRLSGVHPALEANARVRMEKRIGGGFAGQVYKTRLLDMDIGDGKIAGLERGRLYALKIMSPPSGFSRAFRNLLFEIGYQCTFAGQTNPSAVRASALWQKFIRRGAGIAFGTEESVVDIYATFYDPVLRSFGEVNEWVEGRIWKFEIDEDLLTRGKRDRLYEKTESHGPGSVEYLAKKHFMAQFVKLLHEMGAAELARQYEWWTCKSQPNVLKRLRSANWPEAGLTAIDFKAGLVLLPFLPMSPADFRLIFDGMARGNPVQFDRGDTGKLEEFVNKYRDRFQDLLPALESLKEADREYRRSLPDITHHHIRLLTDKELRRDVASGVSKTWLYKGLIDEGHREKLKSPSLRFLFFYLLGIIPFLGKFTRRLMGNSRFRAHVGRLARFDYVKRALRAYKAAKLANWHRDQRIAGDKALKLTGQPVRFWLQWLFLSLLPARIHRAVANPRYVWEKVTFAVKYPIRLYINADFREEWLKEQVRSGTEEGMLTPDEEKKIIDNIKDPFIQKYLKSVAVHVCMMPTTHVVATIVAVYTMFHYGDTWKESLLYAAAVLAIFQGTPISPGSIARELYVLYLVIKERNIKDYWIALLVSGWHYIGYLGFPLQMVARFPTLAQFLASRWATQVVHVFPVFGERGALLEHWVFDFFFNLPLTLKRKYSNRSGSDSKK
jgi:hypothetical protein